MTGAPPNPKRLTLGEEQQKESEKQFNASNLAELVTRKLEPSAVLCGSSSASLSG